MNDKYKSIDSIDRNILLSQPGMMAQKRFWLNKFKILTQKTQFLTPDSFRSFEYQNDLFYWCLDHETSSKLLSICKSSDFPVYVFILTCINIVLYKYTNSENITICSPLLTSETKNDLNDRVYIINNISKKMSFKEVLLSVRKNTLEVYQNQLYPLDIIIEELSEEKPFINTPTSILVANHSIHEALEKYNFDINLLIKIKDNVIGLDVRFNKNLFSPIKIENFTKYLQFVIKEVCNNPDINISNISSVDTDEKHKILFEFNREISEEYTSKRLNEIISDYAIKTPNAIALIHENDKIIYGQLYTRYILMAEKMYSLGIRPDSIICVALPRSIDLIYSVLAIWEIGAIYLPIALDYPDERTQVIINDSGAKYFVTLSKHIKEKKSSLKNIEFIGIEDLANIQNRSSEKKVTFKSDKRLSAISYIIYTSGSTGKPKGVIINHKGMINHLYIKKNDFLITEDSCVAFNSNITFDISIWQMFASLIAGGTTVIFSDKSVLDYSSFIRSIIKYEITILELVPSFLNFLLKEEDFQLLNKSSLKFLVLTGEKLDKILVEECIKSCITFKIVNAYGPTEASDDITHYFLDNNLNYDNIPIGKPLKNNNIVIVNEDLNLCPVGVNGEICVFGIGVGEGYLNDIEKTVSSFVLCNFHHKYKRVYKTGDIGRWLSDGNIEFKGRNNRQIKIHGHRIELDEIEITIKKHRKIQNAVVINLDENIIAFIQAKSQLNSKEIIDFLKERLTQYLIPNQFIFIDEFPLTSNGKIDAKSLSEIAISRNQIEYTKVIMPVNNFQKNLVSIWSEILNLPEERVGINHSFFELGGNSLSAIALINKLKKTLSIALTTKDLFEYLTIEKISNQYINNKTDFIEIPVAPEKDYYNLSPSQGRLYFVHKTNPLSISYNISQVFILEGVLNIDKLTNSFLMLVQRHESFQTSFVEIENIPYQRITKVDKFYIQEFNCSEKPDDIKEIINSFIQPFDLSAAPLIRVGLIRLSDSKYVLIMDMHHIISDGFSHEIILNDLINLYMEIELLPLKIHYKDFSEWQRIKILHNQTSDGKKYWFERLKGYEGLVLPYDFPKENMFDYSGEVIRFRFENQIYLQINQICKENNITLFVFLLSIYNVFLYRITDRKDIIVGTAVSGRNYPDLEQVVGFFINLIAIRNFIRKDQSFLEFMSEVNNNVLNDFNFQDYPFDELIKDIRKQNSKGEDLISTIFSLQEFKFPTHDFYSKLGYKISPANFDYNQKVGHMDLILNVMKSQDNLEFFLIYKTDLFKKETISSIIEIYQNTLLTIVKEIHSIRLGDFVMNDQNNHLKEVMQKGYGQSFDF